MASRITHLEGQGETPLPPPHDNKAAVSQPLQTGGLSEAIHSQLYV